MRYLFLLMLLLAVGSYQAQSLPYTLRIDSLHIENLGGIQSYAFGQHDGKWLIFGGRLDGLHQRQPWAAFDEGGFNKKIFVVEPTTGKVWSRNLDGLPDPVKEQLSSTNLLFSQQKETLYCIGGYGFSPTKQEYLTYAMLSVLNIAEMIHAVQSPELNWPEIIVHHDDRFALTGGKLLRIDNIFYIIGGHRFDGRYNPMGPGTFTQTYAKQVLRFEMQDKTLFWYDSSNFYNEELFHRRDLNVLPQIDQKGEQSILLFSGVFQPEIDIPFVTAVSITKNGYTHVPNFAQYLNHYHCASVSIFDSGNKEMNNHFFGGISQYSMKNGSLTQDADVPFVPTIGLVQGDQQGQLKEYQLPIQMPSYLGAAAEFIVNTNLPISENGVVQLDLIQQDSVVLGYIFGGIKSSAANVFWVNEGKESHASYTIFPVYLIKNKSQELVLNEQSCNGLQLQIYPDPVEDDIYFTFFNEKESLVVASIYSESGELMKRKKYKKVAPGNRSRIMKFKKFTTNGNYRFELKVNNIVVSQYIVVN